MVKYVVANTEDVEIVKALCKAHKTRVTEVRLEGRDEYVLEIKLRFITWLRLKKVLPLGKPVLLHRVES